MQGLLTCLTSCWQGRAVPALLVAVGAGTLAIAFTAEYGFGLEPCILCLTQRVPFGLALLCGLGAFFLPALRWQLVALAGLGLLVNSGIAVYHVGIEQHWWVSVAGCSSGDVEGLSFSEMKKSLAQKTLKSCDEVDWTLLGISMATYNIFYSFVLGAGTLYAAHLLKEGPERGPEKQ